MTKITPKKLAQLLAAARTTAQGTNPEHAQQRFFRALLEATVYAHVPVESPPRGVMRFIQFIRPDNGQTTLPFFSDKRQAEAAANNTALIVAMSGRHLFELTRGASLMLNPNVDAIALYPPEVTALLEGRPLGNFTMGEMPAETEFLIGPPSVSTVALNMILRNLFEKEATVKTAFLTELHREDDSAAVILLLTIVAAKAHQERLLQLVTLAFKTEALELALPLDMRFLAPDESLDQICNRGVQIFGT
jgi:hypothetical protein